MGKHKYIYWRPDMRRNEAGEMFANVHYLIGYNQGSITDLQKMAEEIRKTFPQAKDEDICAGKITASSFVKGFTIVTWSTHLPKGEYPDWYQFDNGKMEYCW